MKKFTIISFLLTPLLSFMFLLAPASASTASPGISQSGAANSACAGIQQLGGAQTCGSSAGSSSISTIIKDVVNLLSLILGALSVVMIIVSGIRFATSGGEANSVSGAKKALIYSIVGLVIAVLAQAILHWVIGTSSTLAGGLIVYLPRLY